MEALTKTTPFPPTADAAWEARLAKELRGADRTEKLVWQHPDGFSLEPYYRKAVDGSTPASILDLGMPSCWTLRPLYTGPSTAVAIREADAAARSREAQGMDLELDAQTAETLADVLPEAWRVWLTGTERPSVAGPWWMDGQCGQAESGRKASDADWAALLEHAAQADGQAQGVYLDAAAWTDAGAHTPDVLGIALAAATEFLAKADAVGLHAAKAADTLQVRLAAGPLYFSEMAAFRAWRILWALLGEGFKGGSAHPEWPAARILGTASTWNLSRADRHGNLIRLSAQTMAAACGGADAVQVPRFDRAFRDQEGWSSPDDAAFSERISQNLALLLRHESHLERVADPGAGSWYLEHLTDEMGRKAWETFQRIEAAGGYSAALQQGLLQGWASSARQQTQAALNAGQRTWIGINRFPNTMEEAPEMPAFRKTEGPDFEPLQPWRPEGEVRKAQAGANGDAQQAAKSQKR